MLIIDKYFNRLRTRFMVGGALVAAFYSLVLIPFLTSLGNLKEWIFAIGWMSVFAVAGLATGALFTRYLNKLAQKKKRKLAKEV